MPEAMRIIFNQALAVTGKGMLALFAFMFFFFLLLIVVDRLFPGKDAKSDT